MKLLILALTLLCSNAFAQNVLFGEKGLFYEIEIFLSILFYLNLLFILIITCLAHRGKKLLTFLTILLENVFILIIGVNFGLEKLSIILFLINPILLVAIILYMVKSKGKFIEKFTQA
jgi:hypothetical protein